MPTALRKTRSTGIYLPADLIREIDAFARRESRSRSNATPDANSENKPVEGEVLPKKRGRPPKAHAAAVADRPTRRRMNLKTLDGTIRESIRVYRELANGKVSVLEAEARGRQLARHATMLKEREEREMIVDLQRQPVSQAKLNSLVRLAEQMLREAGRAALIDLRYIDQLSDAQLCALQDREYPRQRPGDPLTSAEFEAWCEHGALPHAVPGLELLRDHGERRKRAFAPCLGEGATRMLDPREPEEGACPPG
jgi:hypothetical protein